jgi:hypothetical protein
MKSPKPEGIWKTLRIAIILLVANILLVTNFYIYSMYINNQAMDLTLSTQSLADTPTYSNPSAKTSLNRKNSIAQALAYDLPDGYHVSIKPLNWPLTEEALKMRVSACGQQPDANQILSTVDSYQGVTGIEYTFNKDQTDGAYTVTLFPNKRFGSLEEVQKILTNCPDGGQLSPKAVSLSAILFTDACGKGVDGNGCERIRATIEPTLSIE